MNRVTGREFFWDDELIDLSQTTAERRLHRPVRAENVLTFDKSWEGNGCGYFDIVYDDVKGVYRMYYNGLSMYREDGSLYHPDDVRVCCIESADGVHWERPNLGLREFQGDRNNNIIVTTDQFESLIGIDNFYVNVDRNPSPAVPGRFKAVMQFTRRKPDGTSALSLVSLASDDGYRFRVLGTVTEKGFFDTLNTFLWHRAGGKYLCYIRSFHEKGTGKEYDRQAGIPLNSYVRDIRVLESEDFVTWSEPEHIQFDSENDFALYTNCVSAYPGSDMLVGFPTRYVERPEWSPAFDELCGKEERLWRMKLDKRFGLAVTDCLFMCSRDGKNWRRYDEAFLRPGPEKPGTWVYGSCYPAVGFTGGGEELNMFAYDNHWIHEPTVLYRMSLRRDGFASMHAGIRPETVRTRSFVFEGSELYVNVSTSAFGSVKIRLFAEDGTRAESAEMFGDSVDKRIFFEGGIKHLAGKPVQMEIALCDADVYAFEFQ